MGDHCGGRLGCEWSPGGSMRSMRSGRGKKTVELMRELRFAQLHPVLQHHQPRFQKLDSPRSIGTCTDQDVDETKAS